MGEEDIISVYIGFSRTKKWFAPLSWLIRLVENTPYSHVYLRWHSVGAGTNIIYEAAGSYLRFQAGPIFKSKNKIIKEFEFQITKDEYKQLLKFCMGQAGTDYGILQLFGMAAVRLFGLKANPFSQGRKSQVCSEMVGYFLEDVLKKDTGLNLDIQGPKAIYNYLDKQEK